MSDLANNNSPQRPEDPVREESGANGADKALITLSGATPGLEPLPFWRAVLWCVVSGASAGISPILAPFFVGFGHAALAGTGGARGRAISAVCLVAPAAACALLFGFAGLEDALVACAIGVTAAELYLANRLTPGSSCMAVGVMGLALLGISELIARAAGTSLSEQIATMIDYYIETLGASSIETQMVSDQMKAIVMAIWPTAFFVIVYMGFILGIAGARVGAARQGVPVGAHEPFEAFDLPLWVVGLLIGAIVLLAASSAVPAYAELLSRVAGTTLGALRLAFATQGFAVLIWFKREKAWRGLVGLIAIVIALYLEFNMFVLTIVGVLDVWLNLRRLSRGVKVTVQEDSDRS